MPRPTADQLRKINKFSQAELKEDQVYVFRSLSADTLPVKRYSWFGEYSINMSEKMLQKLKKDYQKGVGLLASHNSNRLSFGRTFDAEIQADDVNGESVKTLYIDHYMVTYMDNEDGTKETLPTEIGMSTQDIANHIEVGHTFDTSIGFSIHDPKCSICNNSINDYEKCDHYPGLTYDVDGEKIRCNVLADSGEGIENSLVYAGAVERATIQNTRISKDNSNMYEYSYQLQSPVKVGDVSLYTVGEIKNLPIGAQLICFLSKGSLQLFTTTPERRDFAEYQKGREEMSQVNTNATETAEQVVLAFEPVADVVLKSVHEAELSVKQAELETVLAKAADLETKLAQANEKIISLSVKAELADGFTEDLIQDAVKAGIAARGNGFNIERYEKYLRSLGVSEVKEELSAMRQEFAGSIEAAVKATNAEIGTERNDGQVEMSIADKRQEAARIALQRYKQNGGNLELLTKQAFAELDSAK
ncbi:hypothetical protein [Brevibacillus laterosporus]|uniref:hypothetical protein n=1 Tax=Brevibacillus laterosporus TaxID=1465 RepID=UPI003D1CB9E9